MAKKLYECRYEIVYYAEAECEDDARDCLRDAQNDDPFDYFGVDVREVKFKEYPVNAGWDKGSLLYGTDGDKTLGEALEVLPERPKR